MQDPETFAALKKNWAVRAGQLTISPSRPRCSEIVIKGLGAAKGLASHARVIVEKPFGRDLASARKLNQRRSGCVPGRLDLPH
jgi:glucose-6-phosphate 1-dehydrogenase